MTLDGDQLETHLDFVLALAKTVAPNALNFADQTILFTGAVPFSVEDVIDLLPIGTTWYTDEDLPEEQSVDAVIVGQVNWSQQTIDAALDCSSEPPRFLPQEGFLDELLFGHDWWTEFIQGLNNALTYYPGLQYAKSLETFPWPGTDALETKAGAEAPGLYQPLTPLHRLGYQITGLTRPERWTILRTRGVPSLGLKKVAGTIAGLVRARKRQRGGRVRYRYAISEWEFDLQRLKREFYPRHRHLFKWPNTEP